MQPTTILSLLAAGLLLGLLGLAAWAQHTATRARAAGYNQGFDEARQLVNARVEALHQDLAALRMAKEPPFDLADLLTLRRAASQLEYAAVVYEARVLPDQERFARNMQQQLLALADKLDASLDVRDEALAAEHAQQVAA